MRTVLPLLATGLLSSCRTPAAEAAMPRFRPQHCVLHSGGGERRSVRAHVVTSGGERSPGTEVVEAECWYDSECIARHKEASPTDGFVSIFCSGAECTCTVEQAEEGAAEEIWTFPVDRPCEGDDRVIQLLRERCGG